MKSKIGPPVTGDNYFPRRAITNRLGRALMRGNVSFLGPRRTGKTSILKDLHAHPPAGMVGVLVNLEKHHTVADWLEEMIVKTKSIIEGPSQNRPWLDTAKRALEVFLGRIETVDLPGGAGIKLAPSAAKKWRPTADAFLELLTASRAPILFLLDEFPWFLALVAKESGSADVESVLAWFRHARQDLADHPARFLVTGSIGLDGLVHRLGLSPTVNEFDTVEITPLGEDEALNLLEQLAQGEGVALSLVGRRHILRLLGTNWPVLLQIFISEIQEWQDEFGRGSPGTSDLRRIYENGIVRGNRNKYCSGMWDRMAQVFTPSELRLAREILKALRLLPAGLTRTEVETIQDQLAPVPEHRPRAAEELDYVLDTLRHDGYVIQPSHNQHRIRFASNVLRDYWAARHG